MASLTSIESTYSHILSFLDTKSFCRAKATSTIANAIGSLNRYRDPLEVRVHLAWAKLRIEEEMDGQRIGFASHRFTATLIAQAKIALQDARNDLLTQVSFKKICALFGGQTQFQGLPVFTYLYYPYFFPNEMTHDVMRSTNLSGGQIFLIRSHKGIEERVHSFVQSTIPPGCWNSIFSNSNEEDLHPLLRGGDVLINQNGSYREAEVGEALENLIQKGTHLGWHLGLSPVQSSEVPQDVAT